MVEIRETKGFFGPLGDRHWISCQRWYQSLPGPLRPATPRGYSVLGNDDMMGLHLVMEIEGFSRLEAPSSLPSTCLCQPGQACQHREQGGSLK